MVFTALGIELSNGISKVSSPSITAVFCRLLVSFRIFSKSEIWSHVKNEFMRSNF